MLSYELATELDLLLSNDEMQIGETHRLMKAGIVSAKDLVANKAAANTGAVSNNKAIITSILNGTVPKGASIAKKTSRVVKRLLSSGFTISEQTEAYLKNLHADLERRSEAIEAVEHDQANLVKQSEILSEQASQLKNAIYVYSFPTYLHFGTIEDPELRWLKLGSTKNAVWQRILDQNRQTSMPEDPVLLRIYHSEGMDVSEIERKFHTTLEKVGHERSSATRTRSGTEWFATTEEALDALADLMGLQIESEFSI